MPPKKASVPTEDFRICDCPLGTCVRVVVRPSKDGTSMVNFGEGGGQGKGRPFRKSMLSGAPDTAAQVRERTGTGGLQVAGHRCVAYCATFTNPTMAAQAAAQHTTEA